MPLEGRGAEYIDELGCAASLHDQLAQLLAESPLREASSIPPVASGLSESPISLGGWEVRMHMDTGPIDTFLHMAKARVLIASDSSFSLAAAVLSNGLVLARDGWKRFPDGARRGMRHAITIGDNGDLDAAEGIRAWRASAT